MNVHRPAVVAGALLLVALNAGVYVAQTVARSFEAASVRENASDASVRPFITVRAGALVVTNLPLRRVLIYAFADSVDTQAEFELRLRGGNSRLLERRFDIVARGPAKTAKDTVLMLRTLLADRFGLRFHYQTESTKGWALSLAKPGVLGPKLKPTPHDCVALRASGVPPDEWDKQAQDICARVAQFLSDGGMSDRSAGSLGRLAGLARAVTSMPVTDETGLTGSFEWDVTFTARPDSSNHPSIFEAYRDQLGLQLKPKVQTIQTFVIDDLRPPTEN